MLCTYLDFTVIVLLTQTFPGHHHKFWYKRCKIWSTFAACNRWPISSTIPNCLLKCGAPPFKNFTYIGCSKRGKSSPVSHLQWYYKLQNIISQIQLYTIGWSTPDQTRTNFIRSSVDVWWSNISGNVLTLQASLQDLATTVLVCYISFQRLIPRKYLQIPSLYFSLRKLFSLKVRQDSNNLINHHHNTNICSHSESYMSMWRPHV